MSDRGHVELERAVGSIVVGERHRRDAGDLAPLMDSMKRVGLLQPVTITPDGVLICGYRRLEAARRLGWNTLRVWVRSGISDTLTRLLAERDENVTHKPLSLLEATELYREMKELLQEDADQRKKATQFGPADPASEGESGGGSAGGSGSGSERETAGHAGALDSSAPYGRPGRIDRQAAELVTGRASQTRLEQILEMERIAANRELATDLRQIAETELEAIRNGGAVDPSYRKVKAAQQLAALIQAGARTDDQDGEDQALKDAEAARLRRVRENRARREAQAAKQKRSTRSFALKWAELDGWSSKYDAEQIAREIKPEDWALFLHVLEETTAFADAVTAARTPDSTPDSTPES